MDVKEIAQTFCRLSHGSCQCQKNDNMDACPDWRAETHELINYHRWIVGQPRMPFEEFDRLSYAADRRKPAAA